MTIHHDKMAYGKLVDLSEKLSEEKLKAMAALLSEQPDEAEEQKDAVQKIGAAQADDEAKDGADGGKD